MLNAVLDLVLPSVCAGCGAAGARCCGGCLAELTAAPGRRLPEPAPAGLPDCWSAARYEGAVRQAIVAYKERGAVALAGVLAQVLAYTALTAIGAGALRGAASGPFAPAPSAVGPFSTAPFPPAPFHAAPFSTAPFSTVPFAVVPVPSGRRSRRVRGHDPVGRLAALVVRHLRSYGLPAELWPALTQARRVADQAGLSSAERAANLAGSLQVSGAAKRPPAACALLLDDIVTTGATLVEAARALSSAGMLTPLAVTVAATRRRSCKPLQSR
ncbi:ComF family protein [Nonomuraea zeae]|uniref:ComF family protein n=1 Tax=Nonomuraea zeae TaxID=1642303 RepID=A0A5S4F1U8_9ACTN|nr:ComF family protein [Nonomuraea zeae]